ncbi:hypothetical protein R69746_08758 [Paraburkholderia aspalathi]|uniref:hypothetical protein n=1 Tax=Paraburkholderia aspalathi TaxID=1324617 RepID=UPI001B1BA4AA|nr:hypothetical protein [Paraburkholderia aspalathi]CAE6875629.1 hypothetical protein R69746_08758 [Paraburkholderia aspalathi]
MGYYGGWKPYVPVAERQKKAERLVAKAIKAGKTLSPISPYRGAIAKTFWGKAWCDNLERYSDYDSRLPRGRTYVRNGSVIDLQITGGQDSRAGHGIEPLHDQDRCHGVSREAVARVKRRLRVIG